MKDSEFFITRTEPPEGEQLTTEGRVRCERTMNIISTVGTVFFLGVMAYYSFKELQELSKDPAALHQSTMDQPQEVYKGK